MNNEYRVPLKVAQKVLQETHELFQNAQPALTNHVDDEVLMKGVSFAKFYFFIAVGQLRQGDGMNVATVTKASILMSVGGLVVFLITRGVRS